MTKQWMTPPAKEAYPRAERRRCPPPVLRFSPTAWAKLLYLRDAGVTEIGGFGISRPDDLLFVDEVALIPQRASLATVAFDDLAVADYFETQVAHGRTPAEFARLWIHTHPGNSPLPSGTDEATFTRVFGSCDWAAMVILARNGATYARLQWNVGPSGAMEVPVTVDYATPFPASDPFAWQAEYDECVIPVDGFDLFRTDPERPHEGFAKTLDAGDRDDRFHLDACLTPNLASGDHPDDF